MYFIAQWPGHARAAQIDPSIPLVARLVNAFELDLAKRDAQERSEAAARLGDVFKRLDALDGPPMSSEEIQAEILQAN